MVQENGAVANTPARGVNFYRQVAILRLPQHRDLRLARRQDFRYAGGMIAAPLSAAEIALASRHYPIVFADGEVPTPIAVLGLKPGENAFVDQDGQWREGCYIPAHIRRYPFGLVQTPGTDTYSLAVDEACERVINGENEGIESDAFFDENDSPTPMVSSALELCKAMNRDLKPTDAFARALAGADLLVSRRAEFKLPGDRKIKLDGFRVIDDERFRNLAEDLLPEWHRSGWLSLVSLHLASRQNWGLLAELHAARNPAPAA